MNRMSVVILWALALLVLKPALAAEPRQQPTAREQARTVTIFHQPVVMLQATFGQTTPEERVLRTRSALRAFTEDDIRQPLRVVAVNRYGQPGRLFLMNGKPVLLLSQADLDEGDDLTLDQAAQRVLARMEAQRTSLQEQFNDRYLLLSAGKALAGGLLLALVIAIVKLVVGVLVIALFENSMARLRLDITPRITWAGFGFAFLAFVSLLAA